jgi:endoglucanase
VTEAHDVPDADVKREGEVKIGDGVALGRGAPLSPRVFEFLSETAQAEGIPHTIEVMGGQTSTDADAYHLSRAGIPTGLISLPTRYLHTPTELASLDDLEACVRLATASAQRLSATFGP